MHAIQEKADSTHLLSNISAHANNITLPNAVLSGSASNTNGQYTRYPRSIQ